MDKRSASILIMDAKLAGIQDIYAWSISDPPISAFYEFREKCSNLNIYLLERKQKI